jgi:hypothetical protein
MKREKEREASVGLPSVLDYIFDNKGAQHEIVFPVALLRENDKKLSHMRQWCHIGTTFDFFDT